MSHKSNENIVQAVSEDIPPLTEELENLLLERQQIIESPSYGPSINPYNVIWQISSPVILYNKFRPAVNIRSAGILLDRGFYRLEFTFVNVFTGFGVGLFDPETKAIRQLLAHHSTFYKEEEKALPEDYHQYVNRTIGGIYITIDKSGLIGLSDGNGNYLPKNFKGLVIVTVHKHKVTPN